MVFIPTRVPPRDPNKPFRGAELFLAIFLGVVIFACAAGIIGILITQLT